MAQAGFHGLIGLYGAELYSQRSKKPLSVLKYVVFGFVLGNIIPDADFFLLAPLYLVSADLGLSMHRSFLHSILVIALIVIIFHIAARRKGDEGLKHFGNGLGIGMLFHTGADLLVWFSGVDILWPLGFLGLPSKLNFWTWVKADHLANFLGAFDYLAFGLYYVYLGRLADRQETNLAFLPRLRTFTVLQWIFFLVFTALAFVLPYTLFTITHYAFFILIFLPLLFHVTFRMRQTIEAIPLGK